MQKAIRYLFTILFFFAPMLLWPFTSEVFEFNKIVFVYIITILIVASWSTRMILERRRIFRRTPLDIPMAIFFISQLLSTIASIDPRTSLLGYYSRFNGGLLSVASYILLYWAYVSNIDKGKTLSIIRFTLLSAALVSIYGVLEHFGIDKNVWVQDVQNRVFSTLGQPNWLAAFLIALIPLTWALALSAKGEKQIKLEYFWLAVNILFFSTLLFTKSRSGMLAFVASDITFWGFMLIKNRKKALKQLIYLHLPLVVLFIATSTPWSASVLNSQKPINQVQAANTPALEAGGTESAIIRKIVWKGALSVWKHYPILGTGVETYAYSYYNFRPVEHNLTSEWDFIYNKAHNEYLNYLATTGAVGTLAYLTLIVCSLLQISRSPGFKIKTALLAGYIGILISNFFGFSVVPVALLFFLFPAMATSLAVDSPGGEVSKQKTGKQQKVLLSGILFISIYLLSRILAYWRADIYYAKGKLLNTKGDYALAGEFIDKSLRLSPKEPLYLNAAAESSLGIALSLDQAKDKDEALRHANDAIRKSQMAISLSPANVNLLRNAAGMFLKLAMNDPKYLYLAESALRDAVKLAPTDAKLSYNLGLTQARLGQQDTAMSTIRKTIDMKADYRNARFAYALFLIDKGQKDEARQELNYILEKINPKDTLVIQQLEEIK